MSTQPFLPLFFGDLLASTPTWEGEERALYVILLAYQWSAGPLPLEPKRIAKMCQYDTKTFLALWVTVSTKFVERDGGLVNLRLEEHRAKSVEIANKRSVAGANGAAKRWQKTKQTDSKRMASAIANATDLQCHPSHPIPEEDSRRGEAPPVPDPPDPRKAIFDLGVRLLGERHRGLIGKAVAQVGEKKVAEILGGMAVKPPVDPAAYFAKAIQPEERKVAI